MGLCSLCSHLGLRIWDSGFRGPLCEHKGTNRTSDWDLGLHQYVRPSQGTKWRTRRTIPIVSPLTSHARPSSCARQRANVDGLASLSRGAPVRCCPHTVISDSVADSSDRSPLTVEHSWQTFHACTVSGVGAERPLQRSLCVAAAKMRGGMLMFQAGRHVAKPQRQ